MHEQKFANEILYRVMEALIRCSQPVSVVVNVRLSPASHVTPDGLKGAFELTAEVNDLQNISLNIKPMVLEIICNDCGKIFESLKLSFHCPGCLGTNISIKKHDEFVVDSIEMEEA
ncbi:MAG TPA: hydrogenase/urease maturation nickel metallochaperone HypA [Candidatus Omnitrophota bacterium]|nr:hydrogenase/urease maturation nickel metallochaperone HypA [Candidatus Omnitrophota bacterium]HPT06629.1 hydrogenase/urease maturation nickel metallochaperone HypA [Candidatus Omnitrophota bacterium]